MVASEISCVIVELCHRRVPVWMVIQFSNRRVFSAIRVAHCLAAAAAVVAAVAADTDERSCVIPPLDWSGGELLHSSSSGTTTQADGRLSV